MEICLPALTRLRATVCKCYTIVLSSSCFWDFFIFFYFPCHFYLYVLYVIFYLQWAMGASSCSYESNSIVLMLIQFDGLVISAMLAIFMLMSPRSFLPKFSRALVLLQDANSSERIR